MCLYFSASAWKDGGKHHAPTIETSNIQARTGKNKKAAGFSAHGC